MKERIVAFDARPFPPHRSWMRMTHGQLFRSLDWLHEQIRLDVIKTQKEWPKIELEEQIWRVPEFEGVPYLLWRHRSSGITTDDTLLVEYEICMIGKPERPIFKNTLTFKRVA